MSLARRFALPLLALAAVACSESPTEPRNSLNLGFEEVNDLRRPEGWGYFGGAGYSLWTDEEVVREGRYSLRLQYLAEDNFGAARRTLPVADARGSTVRLSGWIRTADVEPHAQAADPFAGFWMRVDGPDNEVLAFDNMSGRGPSGTTGWQRYELTLQVPENAVNIDFGALLSGRGRAWYDALEIHIDGRPYR